MGLDAVWPRFSPLAFERCAGVGPLPCVHLLVCTMWLSIQDVDRQTPGLAGACWDFRGLFPPTHRYITQGKRGAAGVLAHMF